MLRNDIELRIITIIATNIKVTMQIIDPTNGTNAEALLNVRSR